MSSVDNSGFEKLGETLNSLAAYLLVAHEKHPDYILGDTADTVLSNPTSQQMQIALLYIKALIALGVTVDQSELKRMVRWFDVPLSKAKDYQLDQIELTRLEGLLLLHPQSNYIAPRLELLKEQYRENKTFFISHPETSFQDNGSHTALSVLKILMLARQNDGPHNYFAKEDLSKLLEQVIHPDLSDRDLTLALSLRCELDQKLAPNHEMQLAIRLERAQAHGYFWSIPEVQWRWLKEIILPMHEARMSASKFDAYRQDMREIILHSCQVIENFCKLPEQFDMQRTANTFMKIWWQQFNGKDAPDTLRKYFPDESDFLSILCQTLLAVRIHLRQPLGPLVWIDNLRWRSESWRNTDTWKEKASIITAVRRWIEVEIEDEPTQLHLGLSDASVVRIAPAIYNPMDPRPIDLLQRSLIVKYGPKEDIEKERRHYNQLPAALHNLFVRIPKESFIDDDGQTFVIMEDLDDYETLYEIYVSILRGRAQLADKLGTFLLKMHRGDQIRPQLSGDNHLRDIYIIPMLEHIGRVFNHLDKSELLDNKDYPEIQADLVDIIARILQVRRWIDRFPLAYSHGDLHSRNIMIKALRGRRTPWEHADFEFRLIDLESLNPEGDAAYDAGQLIVDLDLMRERDLESGRIDAELARQLDTLRDDLTETYLTFAENRDDPRFSIRMELGKARALLRVAKGLSKRSNLHLESQDQHQAREFAEDSLNHAKRAAEHLRNVGEGLRNLTLEDQAQPDDEEPGQAES